MEGLRPLGLGELLDAAIRIYRAKARTLLLAVIVPVVPASILSALLIWSSIPKIGTDPVTGLTTFEGGNVAMLIAAAAIVAVLFVVATSMATAACYRSISTAYVGGDVDWKESLRFGFRRVLPVIGLSFLVAFCSYGGLILCIVPGVMAWTFFSVAMPALLVEGQGVVGAMRRSSQLVRGSFWRVLGILLVSYLLVAALQYAISIPINLVTVAVNSPVLSASLQVLVSIISLVIAQPFTAAMTMALYVDLRVRKEGFDLVLWAQRLGAAPPEGGFPVQPGAGKAAPVGWMPPSGQPWNQPPSGQPWGQPPSGQPWGQPPTGWPQQAPSPFPRYPQAPLPYQPPPSPYQPPPPPAYQQSPGYPSPSPPYQQQPPPGQPWGQPTPPQPPPLSQPSPPPAGWGRPPGWAPPPVEPSSPEAAPGAPEPPAPGANDAAPRPAGDDAAPS